MSVSELLLPEFDEEMKKTRVALERVPSRPDFTPHAKSTPLGRLAGHIAQLAGFGVPVLTMPRMEFTPGSRSPLAFESAGQLVGVFDDGVSKVRAALQQTPDAAWQENWTFVVNGKTMFDGPRFLAYRQFFVNHLVHHRAQLGMYLRLNGVAVPATFGPSADERLGL